MYSYFVDVESIAESGAADNIFIFVCAKDRYVVLDHASTYQGPDASLVCFFLSPLLSCIPLVSAVVNMPLSEPDI